MTCLSFINTPTQDRFCPAGDVFGCHKGGRDALSTVWVNSGNAAKHLLCRIVFPNPKIISLKMSRVQRWKVSALDPRVIHSFTKTSSDVVFYFSTRSSKAYFWSFRKTSANWLCLLFPVLWLAPSTWFHFHVHHPTSTVAAFVSCLCCSGTVIFAGCGIFVFLPFIPCFLWPLVISYQETQALTFPFLQFLQ